MKKVFCNECEFYRDKSYIFEGFDVKKYLCVNPSLYLKENKMDTPIKKGNQVIQKYSYCEDNNRKNNCNFFSKE